MRGTASLLAFCSVLCAGGQAHGQDFEVTGPITPERGAGARCNEQRHPRLATTPSGLVVAWVEGSFGDRIEVYARVLDADGPDAEGSLRLSENAVDVSPPAVASIDDGLAVVWIELGRAEAALLDDDGQMSARFTVLQDGRLTVPGVVGRRVGVAAANGRILVAIELGGDVYYRRFTSQGVAIDDDVVFVARGRAPSVATDGRGFVIAFVGDGEVAGRHVSAEGELRGSWTATTSSSREVALGFDGTRFRAVWVDRASPRRLRGVSFAMGDAAWRPSTLLTSEPLEGLDDVTLSRDGRVAVWTIRERVNDHWNLFMGDLSEQPMLTTRQRLTESQARGTQPVVAELDGTRTVVWTTESPRAYAPKTIRGLTSAGTPTSAGSFPAGGRSCQLGPDGVRTENGYLATWIDGRAEGLRAHGAKLQGADFAWSGASQPVTSRDEAYSRARISRLGAGAGVFFAVRGDNASEVALRFSVLGPDGQTATATSSLLTGGPLVNSGQDDPAFAVSGDPRSGVSLAVWRGYIGLQDAILASRVGPFGELLDTQPIEVSTTVVHSLRGSDGPPVVTVADGRWLVVWQDSRASQDELELWSAWVEADGRVFGETMLLAAPNARGLGMSPGAAGLLLTWVVGYPAEATMGVVIDEAGAVSGPPTIVLESPELDSMPHAAAWQDGYVLVWAASGEVRTCRVNSRGEPGAIRVLLEGADAPFLAATLIAGGPQEILLLAERADGEPSQGILPSRRIEAYVLTPPTDRPDAGPLDSSLADSGIPGLDEPGCSCRAEAQRKPVAGIVLVLVVLTGARASRRRRGAPD